MRFERIFFLMVFHTNDKHMCGTRLCSNTSLRWIINWMLFLWWNFHRNVMWFCTRWIKSCVAVVVVIAWILDAGIMWYAVARDFWYEKTSNFDETRNLCAAKKSLYCVRSDWIKCHFSHSKPKCNRKFVFGEIVGVMDQQHNEIGFRTTKVQPFSTWKISVDS